MAASSPGAARDQADPTFGDVRPLLWTIGIAKLVTILLILWASGSRSGAGLIAATTWHWLPLLVVLTGGGWAFRWRLMQARRRRAELLRSEWLVPDDAPLTTPHRSARA